MFFSAYTIISFTEEDALKAGNIRYFLEQRDMSIGPYDVQIAAQGVLRGLVVVTHNVKEFSRVPNLQLEDWAAL